MLLCARCAGRFLLPRPSRRRPLQLAAPSRAMSRDTSEEVPTTFSSDLEENKTSVTILNEDKSMVFFERFGRYGFKLSTGIFVLGPVLAFPKSVYSWRVANSTEVGPASLAALRVIYPRPDIFLLGKGDPSVRLDVESLSAWFRELRISWEILPTEEALATFNFLNAEGRYVAGAFLPPSMRDMYKEEMQALQAARQKRSFQVLDTTGGTYGHRPSVSSASAQQLLEKQSLQAQAADPGEDSDTAEAARLASARVASKGRRHHLEDARKRVEEEEKGDEEEPKK